MITYQEDKGHSPSDVGRPWASPDAPAGAPVAPAGDRRASSTPAAPPRAPGQVASALAAICHRLIPRFAGLGRWPGTAAPPDPARWDPADAPEVLAVAMVMARSLLPGGEKLTRARVLDLVGTGSAEVRGLLVWALGDSAPPAVAAAVDAMLEEADERPIDEPLLGREPGHLFITRLLAALPPERRRGRDEEAPPELVDFMTRSAEHLVTAIFGLEMSDPRLSMLDPAAGTLSFAVAWLSRAAVAWRADGGPLQGRIEAWEQDPVTHAIGTLQIERLRRKYWLTREPSPLELHPGRPPAGRPADGSVQVVLGHAGPGEDAAALLRLAARWLARTGQGVAAISAAGFAPEEPEHRHLRRSLAASFEQLYLLDLGGEERLSILVKRPGLPRAVFHHALPGPRERWTAALSRQAFDTLRWRQVFPVSPGFHITPQPGDAARQWRRLEPVDEILPRVTTGFLPRREPEVVFVADEPPGGDAVSYLVRPFDRRLLVLGDDAADRRQALARQPSPPGLGLVLSARQRVQAGVFVTDRLTDARVLSSHGCCRILPLHAASSNGVADRRQPAASEPLRRRLADAYGFSPTPEQVLAYLYAILWSPAYRRRFTGSGRHELPRVPWPRDGAAFHAITVSGSRLVDLHLLRGREIELAPSCLVAEEHDYTIGAGGVRAKDLDDAAGVLRLNRQGLALHGVTREAWDFRVGGHQVLKSWLDARRGRSIRPEIRHLEQVVAAVAGTLRALPTLVEHEEMVMTAPLLRDSG